MPAHRRRGAGYHHAMSRLLLNLRHVPDDEAHEVRALLESHAIAFYETTPNRWGVSAGAIWIRDDAAVGEAERLLADYQVGRAQRARSAHAAARRSGREETFWTNLRDDPARVLIALLTIILLLGLVWLPVFLLGR
jgi:hypothetical protein